MASITRHVPQNNRVRLVEEKYPLWKDSFPDEVRQQMLHDDILAGESVSMVLFTLITIGLVLAIVSVLCTM